MQYFKDIAEVPSSERDNGNLRGLTTTNRQLGVTDGGAHIDLSVQVICLNDNSPTNIQDSQTIDAIDEASNNEELADIASAAAVVMEKIPSSEILIDAGSNDDNTNATSDSDEHTAKLIQYMNEALDLFAEPLVEFAGPDELQNLDTVLQEVTNWLMAGDTTEAGCDTWLFTLRALVDSIRDRHQASIDRRLALQNLLWILVFYTAQIVEGQSLGHFDLETKQQILSTSSSAWEWFDTQLALELVRPASSDPVVRAADLKQKEDEVSTAFASYFLDRLPSSAGTKVNITIMVKSARSFREDFIHKGDVVSLEKAVLLLDYAVGLAPDDYPDLPVMLNNLGNLHLRRHQQLGNGTDIDSAIFRHTAALAITPDDHAEKPRRLNNLGTCIRMRYESQGDESDITWAVSVLSEGVALLPKDDHDRPSLLSSLGNALCVRFDRHGNKGDIDTGISVLSEALLSIDKKYLGMDKASLLSNLGNALKRRFESHVDVADIDLAITMHKDALSLLPTNHPYRASMLDNLGNTFTSKFAQLNNLDDIDSAITVLEDALALTPDTHLEKWVRYNNLGNAYLMRYTKLIKIADIDSAVTMFQNAQKLIPDDHPDKASLLNNIGNSFRNKFQQSGQSDDINLSISILSEAQALISDEHPEKWSMLNNLGNSLLKKFEKFNEVNDVNKAIAILQKSQSIAPENHMDKVVLYNNLGNSFRGRSEHTHNVSDIDSAVAMLSKALSLASDGYRDKNAILNSLGDAYLRRLDVTHDIADLNSAISSLQSAISFTTEGSDKAALCHTLATALHKRYENSNHTEDIVTAVSLLQEAIRTIEEQHPYKPIMLNTLGSCFRSRFEKTKDIDDINFAISNLYKAVNLLPKDHLDKSDVLNNLGNSLSNRYELLHNLVDINSAIKFLQEAIYLIPDDHFEKAGSFNNLGSAFYSRFEHLQEKQDLDMAITQYSAGALQKFGPPSVLMHCTMRWIHLIHIHHYNKSIFLKDAYPRALELLSRVAWIGLDVEKRFDQLRDVPSIAADAAAWAIEDGNYKKAIEWLEEGRSIIWRQALQLRSPLQDLQGNHPDLAKELAYISKELESGGLKHSVEQSSRRHRELADKWEHLIQSVRALPGYEEFLLSKTFDQLALASTEGPVVILNASRYSCDALIIKAPSEPLFHIQLSITYEEVHKLHQSFSYLRPGRSIEDPEERHIKKVINKGNNHNIIIMGALHKLWTTVMEPVVNALDLKACSNPPRVWWCPTGPFASLPIHAAGIYNSPGPSASDFMVFSYATTLDSLIPSQNYGAHVQPFKILAISQEVTPGATPLPATKEEVACIRNLAPHNAFVALEGPNATVDAVLEHLAKVTWVHLACHGKQDSIPLNSAFLLQDGNLELSTIMQNPLPQAEIAFLSACQTATGDHGLFDESSHLAAGLLFAGFKGVIATLWSIADADGPIVAEAFYNYLFQHEKIDAREAAHALHAAINCLRGKGVPLDHWAPFIHIGK